MGRKLKNAPVYFTIAQVRFNPILSLDSFLSGIQEKMRVSGYPDYKREILQSISFGVGDPNQSSTPTVQPLNRYGFSDIAGQSGFSLENNAISYYSVNYGEFDSFSARLLEGVSILHEAVALSFTERIGVRYLDAVMPGQDEELSKYISPAIMGIFGKLEGSTLVQSFAETITSSDAGKLVSRAFIHNGKVGYPTDLAPFAPKPLTRFQEFEGLHAILDTDSSNEAREPFNSESLTMRLDALHKEASKSFKAAVTEYALKAWDL